MTLATDTIEPTPPRSRVNDAVILALFRGAQRLDTYEIAKRLNVRESDVANRLALLRDQERQG